MQRFNKYSVALKLSQEKVGRREVLNQIYNKRIFDDSDEVSKYMKKLREKGIRLVSYFEDEYPDLLKQIFDYPLLLFCRGDMGLLKRQMITIVGTRQMSEYGKWAVEYILRPFSNRDDIVVVSGLAKGVDGYVHKTCIKFNIPTIAVVAGGLDKGYPKSNQKLYDKLLENNLVISEFPPGRSIIKGMFPMRNRILAGISSATVVIESDLRGGSMITANLALEYGRGVFATPCDINRYSSQGCNSIISQGAEPIFNQEKLVHFIKNLSQD
jgi:DNA processing protein